MTSGRLYFQIARRSALRAAVDDASDRLDGIWSVLSNDEFYELAGYVRAYADVTLRGYRRSEEAGAFDAVQKTLDGLDKAVELMNDSDVLRGVADAIVAGARPDEDLPFETAWDQLVADAHDDDRLASCCGF